MDTSVIISIVISGIALAISGIVGYITWKNRHETRLARDYTIMARILDTLDNDKARKDREYIYTIFTRDGFASSLTLKEVAEIDTTPVERVINSLENMSFFLIKFYSDYNKSPEWVWEMTEDLWLKLKPFIEYFRTQEGRRKGYAQYFEQLFTKAMSRKEV